MQAKFKFPSSRFPILCHKVTESVVLYFTLSKLCKIFNFFFPYTTIVEVFLEKLQIPIIKFLYSHDYMGG